MPISLRRLLLRICAGSTHPICQARQRKFTENYGGLRREERTQCSVKICASGAEWNVRQGSVAQLWLNLLLFSNTLLVVDQKDWVFKLVGRPK